MYRPASAATVGLLRFTTIGSVDDGKSTLIGRLLCDANAVPRDRLEALARIALSKGEPDLDLSLLTDGLSAEREQGITIDVAYGYFATPRRKFVIADTPGHEQYTRNMVTGASTADAAVLLVDASRGVALQTRRHLFLSHLLGVRHLIVAVNKMDLVDFRQSTFAEVGHGALRVAAAIGARQPHLIPISARHGDNVVHSSARTPWYHGPPLLSLLESLPDGQAAREAPFRLPVQLVRRVRAAQRGWTREVLGRIESGRAAPGDKVLVLPSGIATRIARIGTFEGALSLAAAPKSVSIELEDDIDIARGDMLAAVSAPPFVSDRASAKICWFYDRPLATTGPVLIRSATRRVAARITAVLDRLDLATMRTETRPEVLERNDIATIELRFSSPLVLDPYQRNRATGAFIMIDQNQNATLAAGMFTAAPQSSCAPHFAGCADA
jgi:sulfate adenylyltransferase large subunit